MYASSYTHETRCRIERCRSTKGQETYIFVKDGREQNTNKTTEPQTVEKEKNEKGGPQVNGCLMSKPLWSNNTMSQ